MPKQSTPKDTKPTCYHCHIPIREIHFAYWVASKPHCSLGCAHETKKKMGRVNRWKQKA